MEGGLRRVAGTARRRVRRELRRGWKQARQVINRLRTSTISRERFLADLRGAVAEGRGYAFGKNGSEQWWMYYPILLERETDPGKIAAFEKELRYHALRQSGIFPDDLAFYVEYNHFYVEHVRNLDCLGVTYYDLELPILDRYELDVPLIHYFQQEPDASIPSDESNCYLPAFRDKRVLIVCPFAEFLADRADAATYEAVWARTGRQWFHPRSVDALEFPYGFEPATWDRYGTVFDLYEEIAGEMSRREFDVALIGAAGMAIPLASHAKSLGKVGLDLGGHLQVMFGVLGQRWKNMREWRERYVTDAWVEMPERYAPSRKDVCDSGAYW